MDRDSDAIGPETEEQIHLIRRVTWVGMGINLFLSALKFTVGYIGESQAVIADAVHSLSDMTTDLAVIFGVKYWTAPADEGHPYGHRRIETIITAAIGVSLAAVALGIGYRSLTSVRAEHLAQPGWIALIGALVSVVAKEGIYRWTISVGRRTGSSSVSANAWHHRSDALSSIPAIIAVGAAIMSPKLAFLDHVGALVVSIFILKVSWDIGYPALSELSDSGASLKDLQEVTGMAAAVSGVLQVESVRTRRLGNGLHVDLHIKVDGELSVRSGHNIAGAVKRVLVDKGPDVLDVIVHVEPHEGRGGDG